LRPISSNQRVEFEPVPSPPQFTSKAWPTSTGCPFCVAGKKRHEATQFTAAESKTGTPLDCTTVASLTVPSVAMR
jgi:hypothetical protein